MTLRAKYAVFLPVRNGAAYLREAIDSVISQTYNDWLLVVLDNASSDGSAEIALAYGHPRISVQHSTASLPIWESWHRIWAVLSNGEVGAQYATIIGHDDVLLPCFLESIDRLINAYPHAGLYQTPFDMIDEKGSLIRPCRPIPAIESSMDFLAARLWGLRDSVGTGYVFRPADYVATGGIPDLPHLLYADDLLFARLSKGTFKATTRDSHCLYRLHRGSTSYRLTSDRIEGQVAATEQFIELLNEEFPEFMRGRAGGSALACFLAREIMLLRPLARCRLLAPVTRKRIQRLEATYARNGTGIDYRQWLGTNFVSRNFYAHAKQLMLFYVLARAKAARAFNWN